MNFAGKFIPDFNTSVCSLLHTPSLLVPSRFIMGFTLRLKSGTNFPAKFNFPTTACNYFNVRGGWQSSSLANAFFPTVYEDSDKNTPNKFSLQTRKWHFHKLIG